MDVDGRNGHQLSHMRIGHQHLRQRQPSRSLVTGSALLASRAPDDPIMSHLRGRVVPSCVHAGTRKWLSTTRRVLLGAAGGWIGKFCRYTKVLQHSIPYPSPSSTTFNEPHSYVHIYIYKPRLWISESSPIYIAEAETVSGQESEPTLLAQSKCDFGSRIDMKRGWEMMGTQYERNDSAIVSVANYNI